MEQLFGGSVAQGGLKFTPMQHPKESVYIHSISLDVIHSSLPNVGNISVDCDDIMSDNDGFHHSQTNLEW
ncbi:DNA-directed RNA polymerase I subunit RPA2, partial [Bienertia sinuspersici]